MQVPEVASPVGPLRAGVDDLLAADLDRLDATELASLLDDVESQRRRLDAFDVRLVSAVNERRRAGDYAACTTVDLLVHRLRIDPREATRRVARAGELAVRRTLTGEQLPPLRARTAEALAAGDISAAHADVVARYAEKVENLGDAVPDGGDIAEELLVKAARHEHPKLVAQLGERLVARLDPDGTAPKDADLERERSYSLVKHADGSSTPRGRLTPEATAA